MTPPSATGGGSEPVQLVLDLGHTPATARSDFMAGACNAAALDLIDRWPDWPHATALIVGPLAAGKSHLARVWRDRTGAEIVIAAAGLDHALVERLRSGDIPALVVEDLDRGITDERVLFHLMNTARETRRGLLLTSRRAPGDLEVALPDLRSRLRASAPVTIEPPDDAVLAALLVKLFADRQLEVEPPVVAYLGRHMERSFAAAERVVAAIDRLALARRRAITRAIAAEALRADGAAAGAAQDHTDEDGTDDDDRDDNDGAP